MSLLDQTGPETLSDEELRGDLSTTVHNIDVLREQLAALIGYRDRCLCVGRARGWDTTELGGLGGIDRSRVSQIAGAKLAA